jgi:hypothetical protein
MTFATEEGILAKERGREGEENSNFELRRSRIKKKYIREIGQFGYKKRL